MRKALFQLHFAVFLAGFTAILGKLILLNEGLLVLYRLLLTVISMGILLYFRKTFRFIPWQDILKIMGVGIIVSIHWVTFYGSVKYANVSVAVVCISASGFFTAFLDPLITGRRILLIEVLLGLLAIVGIYIIFDFHPQYKTGIIFGIISALGSALFPIYNKNLLKRFSPGILTFYLMLGGFIGLLFLLPIYLWQFPADYYLPTKTDWMWLLLLANVCTVYSFYLQLNALRKISAFTSNLSYNLEPVYSILLAFLIFGENHDLSIQFYLGVLLIILAVVLQMVRTSIKSKNQLV
ncbi:MAG: DMT family transporter [Ferruginibacter sp.]